MNQHFRQSQNYSLAGMIFFPRGFVMMALAIVATTILLAGAAVAQDTLPKVREPGAILKIIHNWPPAAQDQDKLITHLVHQGFSGVVCNVSFKDYLESTEAWNSFHRAVDRAHQSGMELWLYDEAGYPSGTAGHLVLTNHPEWEAEGLLTDWKMTDGQQITLKMPPGKIMLAAAYPWIKDHLDLSKKADLSATVANGQLTWKPDNGKWIVVVVTRSHLYEGTHAELNLAEKRPYLNLMQAEPTERFIDVTHQRYFDRLGSDFKGKFVSTFTDEPSLMSVFLRPMPYRPLPWSPGFSKSFKSKHGYAIEPLIPLLLVNGGEKTGKVRYDFWQTVGQLTADNYFGQIRSWCDKHDIYSGGHLLLEEGGTAQVGLYGDFFSCTRRLSAPGIDCLTSIPAEVPWQVARQASSAADLNGGGVPVMCETSDHCQHYRPAGDKTPIRYITEAEIRGTCNKLMAGGVSRITSYYSYDKLDDAALQRINHGVASVCSRMRGGIQSADIALLYPVESLWPAFVPSRHWAGDAAEAQAIEYVYHEAANSLYKGTLDFTVIDSRSIAESTIQKDTLRHGKLAWKVIVLPRANTLPIAAWEKLARWVKKGGVVIALGVLPTNSETDFPSKKVLSVAKEMFGGAGEQITFKKNAAGGMGIFLPNGTEWMLPEMINSVMVPDVQIALKETPIRYTHRRYGDCERYFIINDSAEQWNGTLKIRSATTGTQINPNNDVQTTVNGQAVQLELGAYQGTLLEFASVPDDTRKKQFSGSLPTFETNQIHVLEPSVGKGEFVRDQISGDLEHSTRDGKVWIAKGTLTKSQVDVFLFTNFHFDQPLDLAGTTAMEFDTWVPAGQERGPKLMVIVHEENGGDYYVNTSRDLSRPGLQKVMVPLNSFQLAGWSKDQDGRMDWSKVTDIRIGWGGYTGDENQVVQFSFSEPRRVTLH